MVSYPARFVKWAVSAKTIGKLARALFSDAADAHGLSKVRPITTEDVPCNVIVNTHITTVEGSTRLYPDALGSKLGPKLGRYFDNMITISTSGGKKVYKTKQDGAFACKTAIPLDDTYPLETGLATIFDKLKKG